MKRSGRKREMDQQQQQQPPFQSTGSEKVESANNSSSESSHLNSVKSVSEELSSMLHVAAREYEKNLNLQIEYWNQLSYLRKRGAKLHEFMNELESVLRQPPTQTTEHNGGRME